MDLPVHPEADDPQRAREPSARPSVAAMLFAGVGAALLVVIILLHLTGVVGSAGH